MEAVRYKDFNSRKIEESEVITRILKGEKELYELLVRRNNQKLYRVIRSYLKEEDDIEDSMQNTYLKAFTKLHQFKLESSFSTWLIRIGINEALARIKKKGKLFALPSVSNDPDDAKLIQIPDTKQLNPQDQMIRNEIRQLLEDAIDTLDTKYKTVYIMKEVEGMSLKEISIALELTLSNVKIRLYRSKEMLKDKLYEVSNHKNIFEFGFNKCDRLTENVMRLI